MVVQFPETGAQAARIYSSSERKELGASKPQPNRSRTRCHLFPAKHSPDNSVHWCCLFLQCKSGHSRPMNQALFEQENAELAESSQKEHSPLSLRPSRAQAIEAIGNVVRSRIIELKPILRQTVRQQRLPVDQIGGSLQDETTIGWPRETETQLRSGPGQ